MIIALRIFVFLLPFIAFYLWYRTMKKLKAEGKEGQIDPQTEKQLTQFSTLGIVALIAAVAVLALTREENTEGDYIAPKFIDGEIKPGEVKKKP